MYKKNSKQQIIIAVAFVAGFLLAKYVPIPFIDSVLGLKEGGK